MKKSIITLILAFAFCGITNAQYYYYSSRPWDGDKSYSLNIGSVVPINFYGNALETATSYSYHFPMAASFRYFGEKAINERLSWGYQFEVSWLKYGVDFEKPSETAGQTLHGSFDKWDLPIDVRFTLGYYFTDNFELVAGVGFGYCLFNGIKSTSYETNTATGAEIANSQEVNEVPLNYLTFDPNVDAFLAGYYYLNENVFLSLSLRDRIGIPIESFLGEETSSNGLKQYGIALFGIGYKFIR